MPEDKKPSKDLRDVLLARKMNMGETLRDVKDYYGKGRDWGLSGTQELPFVAPPSWFQPDPLVVGQPGFAIAAKKLVDLDPITKTSVRSITQGPTDASMRQMMRSGLPPDFFGGTTLQGIYDLHRHDIGVNPLMSDNETLRTLAHEIAHASAYGEGDAQKVEPLVAPTDEELMAADNKRFDDELRQAVAKLNAKGIKVVIR